MRTLHFYVDFDGTIAQADVVDRVLGRFASGEWEDVEREWVAGRIGSRECLSRQISCVRASEKDLDNLLAGIGVDPGFDGFVKAAKELEVPVTIVSDGFDLFIRALLAKKYPQIPVYSSALKRDGERLVASFPEAACGHGCATCKPAVMARTRRPEDFIVFVGDGLSDRYAAQAADLTFAKAKLLDFCAEKRLKHRPYADFREIELWLRQCREGQDKMRMLHLS